MCTVEDCSESLISGYAEEVSAEKLHNHLTSNIQGFSWYKIEVGSHFFPQPYIPKIVNNRDLS